MLTVEEFARLRDACAGTPHMRLFVILAITTAGRSEVIVQLLWVKVDFGAVIGRTVRSLRARLLSGSTLPGRSLRSIVPRLGLAWHPHLRLGVEPETA